MSIYEPNAVPDVRRNLDLGETRGTTLGMSRGPFIERLYLLENRAVLDFVFSLVADEPLAEDLTNESFLLAYERFHQLRSHEDARGWLFSIARNLVRKHWRRKRLIEWVGWRDRRGLSTSSDEPALPEVVRALAELSFGDREVVLLRGKLGFTAAEIGQVLHISTDAAQKRCQRARARLLRLLEDEAAN